MDIVVEKKDCIACIDELRRIVETWPDWAKIRLGMLMEGYQRRGVFTGEFELSDDVSFDSRLNWTVFPVQAKYTPLTGEQIQGPDGNPIFVEAIERAFEEMVKYCPGLPRTEMKPQMIRQDAFF